MRTRPLYYTLDANGQPVPCDDVIAWGAWFQTADRHVGHDLDEGDDRSRVRVSTVFLGLDHNHFGDGPPVLWETMVFGGVFDGEQVRYSSLAEAVEGHQNMCARVGAAIRRP